MIVSLPSAGQQKLHLSPAGESSVVGQRLKQHEADSGNCLHLARQIVMTAMINELPHVDRLQVKSGKKNNYKGHLVVV